MTIPHRKDVVREFQGAIDPLVVTKAVRLGLVDHKEEAEDKLRRLIWYSAPHKHPEGNRRNRDWIFRLTKDRLVNIHRIKCSNCEDHKRVVVYEECHKCEGRGCYTCRKTGELEGAIPCPDCSTKR